MVDYRDSERSAQKEVVGYRAWESEEHWILSSCQQSILPVLLMASIPGNRKGSDVLF